MIIYYTQFVIVLNDYVFSLHFKIIVTTRLFLTGGAQCYGDTVTLVCEHPVLPHEPEFPQADVGWRRDGGAISTVGLGLSTPNSTITRLQFTITEDSIGNYTCFLVNIARGELEESNSVSVTRPPGEYVMTLAFLLQDFVGQIFS